MKRSSKIQKKKKKLIGTTLILLALLTAFITLTVLSAYETDWKLDLTQQKLFTLTQETEILLEQVDAMGKDIRIAAVYPEGQEETMVIKLLERYSSKSNHIKAELIDAEKDPSKLADYPLGDILAVYNGSLIVTCEGRTKVIPNNSLFSASEQGTLFYGEREISGAVRYVTAKELPVVYFTSGHGEISAGSNLLQAISELKRNAYDVKQLVMLQEGIPEDASVMIMASPTQDITQEEYILLSNYMERGGKLMLLVDPFMTTNTNRLERMNQLTNQYGIDISNNYVVEEDSGYYLAASDLYLIPRFSSHEITASIGEAQRMVVLPMARGLGSCSYDEKKVERSILLLSSEKAWSRNDMTLKSEHKTDSDIAGPIALGLAAEKSGVPEYPGTSKMVVIGDSNFIVDGNYEKQADSLLFMNSVNWLHGDRDLNHISGKKIGTDSLLVRGNTFIKLVIICCLVLPLLSFSCAIFMWYRERNR